MIEAYPERFMNSLVVCWYRQAEALAIPVQLTFELSFSSFSLSKVWDYSILLNDKQFKVSTVET